MSATARFRGCKELKNATVVGQLWLLQAFIDESYNNQTGVYVLGGYIASEEAWAKFSNEWKEMLPNGTQDKHGRYHFGRKAPATA
jgi:hypothetical protein